MDEEIRVRYLRWLNRTVARVYAVMPMPGLDVLWAHPDDLWERVLTALAVVDTTRLLAMAHVAKGDWQSSLDAYLSGYPGGQLQGLQWVRGRLHHHHFEAIAKVHLSWERPVLLNDDTDQMIGSSVVPTYVWPTRLALQHDADVLDTKPSAEAKPEERRARAYVKYLQNRPITHGFRGAQEVLHHVLGFSSPEFWGSP